MKNAFRTPGLAARGALVTGLVALFLSPLAAEDFPGGPPAGLQRPVPGFREIPGTFYAAGAPSPRFQAQNVGGTRLSSGDPITFRLPPVEAPFLFTEGAGYRVFVPAGQTQLQITVEIQTPGADVDLFVRFGTEITLSGGFPVADFTSATPGDAPETVTITPGSSPPLQSGFYFIGLGLQTTGMPAFARITADITGGTPPGPAGQRVTSGVAAPIDLIPVGVPTLFNGLNGYRIDVPDGATQLNIRAAVENPLAAIQIAARHGFDPLILSGGGLVADGLSTGGSPDEILTISGGSPSPLTRGTYFIAIGTSSIGIPLEGTITATVVTGGDPPAVGLSTSQLTFNTISGQGSPPSQEFTVTNSGGGTLSYMLSANQPWVTLSPTSGTSSGEPRSIMVGVDTGALTVGSHHAVITVDDLGSGLTAAVAVTVNISSSDPPQISLSTTALEFEVPAGSPPTAPGNMQPFTIGNSGGGEINYMISSNQDWLFVNRSTGTLTVQEQTLTAIVDPAGLDPGLRNAVLTIADTAQDLMATIAVTLNVLETPPAPAISIEMLEFNAALGGSNPAPQPFSVSNAGSGSLQYVISTSESWIQADPSSGTVTEEFDTILVSVDISTLPAGTSTGELTVSNANASLTPSGRRQGAGAAVLTVIVNIEGSGTPPNLPNNAVVNAASFVRFGQPGHAMAPQSIVSIFGTDFIDLPRQALSIPLPIALRGVSVTVDGMPAPLFFISAGQINALLPGGLAGPTASIVVRNGAGPSTEREIQIATFSPAVFSLTQDGMGQGIITFADPADPNFGDLAAPRALLNALNADGRPATSGDFLTIWCNGLGPVDPPVGDGRNSTDEDGAFRLRTTTATPTVLVGGQEVDPGDLLFSGLAPAFVGLYQINLRVRDLPAGDAVPLVIRIGGVESRSDITVAIE